MASAVLFLFSASIMMFQLSCSKTANAGTTLTTGVASKIIYQSDGSAGFYIKNADGTGSTTNIKPSLPSGYFLSTSGEGPAIQSDGTYVYFFGANSSNQDALFRCDMNGLNVIRLTTETPILSNFNIF